MKPTVAEVMSVKCREAYREGYALGVLGFPCPTSKLEAFGPYLGHAKSGWRDGRRKARFMMGARVLRFPVTRERGAM